MRHGGPRSVLGADPTHIEGASIGRDVVKRVWSFAQPYRRMLAWFLLTIVLGALVAIVPPLLIRRIIDDALPQQDNGALSVLAGLMVLVAFTDAALSLLGRLWSSRIGEGLIFDLRVALFDHVQRMPIAFFTRTQTGALISRMNNDVIGAQRAVTDTMGSIVSNVIVLATTLGAMIFLEWRLTLMALLLLPVFILPAKRVGRRMQSMTREQMDLNASMNTTMTERFNVSGALLVKLFGRHKQESADFSDRADRVRAIGVRSALYGRTFFISLGLVASVATAFIYWFGGRLVISGAISIGTLVALGAYVTRIYQPLTSLTNARVDLMTALVSFDRVFEVLDAPNPIEDKPDAEVLTSPAGRIELDHVSFRYPPASEVAIASLEVDAMGAVGEVDDRESAMVLHDLTVTIEPGQLVALVGPSGAGKTTLSNLVPRLYDVTGGAIRIDGHDVRDVTQRSLRQAIGVVSQDPHLFHESVGDNLRYARADATEAQLMAACKAARIYDVVQALPDGFDTVVGERGYRLSGGEKQRLSIARMILKDPCIVILDEATSHLDSENEAAVQEALAVSLEGRTSLVIAHRLSTITSADLILVLEEGRLVEQGTHTTLLADGGLYSDLYRLLVREETSQPA